MSLKPKKTADDELHEALMRLRHAAFALAGSSNSLNTEDRDMAENYLKETARYYYKAEERAGRIP